MRSDRNAASARSSSLDEGLDQISVSKQADLLIKEHGGEADIVAMNRADALFARGDQAGGTWWLEIFRRIALAPIRRAHIPVE